MAALIGLLAAGFVVIQVINRIGNGGGGWWSTKFIHVPDGQNWQTFYRQLRDQQSRPGGSRRWFWIFAGLAVGSLAVGLLLSFAQGG